MKAVNTLALIAALLLISAPTSAATPWPGPDFDFEFTYADPAGDTLIPDSVLRHYSLEPTLAPGVSASDQIVYLELEIAGLNHAHARDLMILLLDPVGTGVIVMDDFTGDQSLSDLTVVFSNFSGKELPLPSSGPILPGPNTIYEPTASDTQDFTAYDGVAVGTAPWQIIIIDQAPFDEGSIGSVTLRGHVVPEPMTLSLLAVGALFALRRKRR